MEKEFYIKQSNRDMQINEVKDLLSKSYWASKRDEKTIEKSIENSLCFGAFLNDNNKQIAFARVITDYSTVYYICDVIVNEDYRGHGIGKELIKAVVTDDILKDMKAMLLTADAHTFHEKFGFKKVEGKYMAKE